MKIRVKKRWWIGSSVLLVLLVALWYARLPAKGHTSTFIPADSSLHKPWLYFYSAQPPTRPRGFVFFLGNDIAFWEPHQDLAMRLSAVGFNVVGLDVRKYLDLLPPDEPRRDSAFDAAIGPLIAKVRRAMSSDSLPLILAGHSFGAELAFWTAWHRPPPRLVGVLSLNSRSRGHLFVTAADWLNKVADDKWSFSVVEAAGKIDPRVKIALVRGSQDSRKEPDTDFEEAGGPRLRRISIPFAGHSLKSLMVAGPFILRGVEFLMDTAAAPKQ